MLESCTFLLLQRTLYLALLMANVRLFPALELDNEKQNLNELERFKGILFPSLIKHHFYFLWIRHTILVAYFLTA